MRRETVYCDKCGRQINYKNKWFVIHAMNGDLNSEMTCREDICAECMSKMLKAFEPTKCELADKTAMKKIALHMVYAGFSDHDCESHHKCPTCGEDYGSWELFRNGIKNGSTFECKECGQKLIAPR